MKIADTAHEVPAEAAEPLCVLAPSLGDPASLAVLRLWGLDGSAEAARPTRRPAVRILDGGRLDVTLFALDADREPIPLRILCGDQGMLVVAPAQAQSIVRPAVQDARGIVDAVVEIVLAVARRCEEILDRLDDEIQEDADRETGYTSSPQRRTMGRLRARLFRIQEMQAAQSDLLAPEEELAHVIGHDHRRRLRRAAAAFAANRSLASRLYAMVGDLLNEQDTIVNERLTLVATIFLPLTLATGFFGMNFGWMQDHLGGATSFVLLGIVVPAVATVATFVLIRRLTSTS